jgi:2-methylcitrate dehydratase PrpD
VTSAPPIAERIGRYAASIATAKLAPEVRLKAATCLLDGLALGIAAGSEATTAGILRSPFLALGVDGPWVWAAGARTPLSEAVWLNGYAVHARFQDDCDMASWSHPGSLVLPAAVGAAEATGATLELALRGIVTGYSVLNWLGAEEKVGRGIVDHSFRASPTLGPIAAAAATATVLGLSAEQAANAAAIAAASAGGLIETVRSGSADWRFQNGSAAWRGVVAALLAQQGVDGAQTIFESPKGFLKSFAGIEPPPETERDPRPESILDVWAKPYPTLGDNVAVVAAALELRHSSGLEPTTVAEIRVHQNAGFASYPGTSYRGPYDKPAQAMASTAFAVSAALARGAITLDLYSTALADPLILSLVEKLSVTPEAAYGYLDGKVAVITESGHELSTETCELPRELFYRDPATATAAFAATLREVGISGPASAFAEALLTRVSSGDTGEAIGDVVAEAMALRQEGTSR